MPSSSLGAALAAAHIETDPPAVQAGTQATVGFVVEHGCGESNTTGMDIKLPAGITDATASKHGWTVSVADGVVRFSDGELDHDTEDTFDVTFTAPTTPGFVTFPTVQICGDTEQPWLDETVEGQPEPEHPAPRLEITQGPPTSDELTVPVDTDDDADGTTTTAAAATTTTAVATTTAPATTAATTTAAPTTAAATDDRRADDRRRLLHHRSDDHHHHARGHVDAGGRRGRREQRRLVDRRDRRPGPHRRWRRPVAAPSRRHRCRRTTRCAWTGAVAIRAMTITESGVRTIDGVELTPKDVNLEGPPVFATIEEERLHRKQKLAGALRIFGRVGFGEGVAGHITVRDPEFPDCFWVNPFAVSFRHIRVSDLILVDHEGNVIYGTRPVNRAAFILHSAIHEARPDVMAAAHSHSVHGKAFSSLGIKLDPITQDSCIFYNDHTVITEQGGAVVFEIEAGRQVAAAFGANKAAIHQNHGLFTVGQTVDEAVFWFLSMDRSCQAQLLAMAAGTPKLIPHDLADYTAKQTGFPLAGWLSFQPLWQEICRTDPDLFD